MKLTDSLSQEWQWVLFAPSLLAMTFVAIWPRAMTNEFCFWTWMILNVGCSLATSMHATQSMASPVLRWSAAVFVGAMFCFMNLFVSFFGGCCAVNWFHP